MTSRHHKLPVAALERIDDACVEFENAWRRHEQPEIESVLQTAGTEYERTALLAELLALDCDYRRKRGESPQVQDYRKRFPNDQEIVEKAVNGGETKATSSRFEPPSISEMSKLFPELEILELIGSGGMGAVYKARQKGLDRLVAIKILPDEVGRDVKFALRFTREARALARLSHPHIVSVHEFGNAEGTYYFLMEYVDGSNLREVMRTGQLRPEQALEIVPHICEALQYAHDQGVVHRDIKPENILIDRGGRVTIADFGLARLLGNESKEEILTATHQVMGTPRYMAPEQMEGSHRVDHRADIYSLGVVFYEMLTGELPLGRFAAPSKKVQIDVRLDDVVLRTLEKEPQSRYQRASQVASDLESIASTPGTEPTSREVRAAQNDREPPEGTASLERQELAARVLLLRRELMSRIASSLKPLFRGQIVQIIIGVVIIALGVLCWAPNQHLPHKLASGITLHVYGVLIILSAGITCGKINGLDYSRPLNEVRSQLDSVRKHYLRSGPIIGFSWWLMWLPLCVAVGFDAVVLYPASLWVSLLVGIIGMAVSLALFYYLLRSENPTSEKWKGAMEGESLRNAYRALEEIERAELK